MDQKLRISLAGILAVLTAVAAYFTIHEDSFARFVGLQRGSSVKAGFVGVAPYGHWRLICVPGPASLKDITAVSFVPSAPPVRSNSCRINQEIANPALPKGKASILLAVNFGLLGDERTPAIMIRLPATAKPGDILRVNLDRGKFFATTVRECNSECLAAGPLAKADWLNLKQTRALQVEFPVSNGQAVLLDVPVDGLEAAIPAMEQAQSAPRP